MFDVNQPQSLGALTKWWDDFRDKAPVPDELVDEFCCVLVGNKIDVAQAAGAEGMRNAVSEAQAREFIHTLVPHPQTPPSPSIDLAPPDVPGFEEELEEEMMYDYPSYADGEPRTMTDSIDISGGARRGRMSRTSRSQSRSTLFRGGATIGTVTTMHSIYHTPSSSLFDTFESALSSPAFTALSAPLSRSPSHSPLRGSNTGIAALREPRRIPSTSSMSSAPTITPSLFVRGYGHGNAATTTATTPESGVHSMRPPPERYPRLFFTSAKTGDGVRDVFEYIARRVVVRQEYEEALEARTMHVQEAGARTSIVHLSGAPPDRRGGWTARGGSCCGT